MVADNNKKNAVDDNEEGFRQGFSRIMARPGAFQNLMGRVVSDQEASKMSRVESGRGQKVSVRKLTGCVGWSRVQPGGSQISRARPARNCPPCRKPPCLSTTQAWLSTTKKSIRYQRFPKKVYIHFPTIPTSNRNSSPDPIEPSRLIRDDSLRLIHGVPQFPRSLARGELY